MIFGSAIDELIVDFAFVLIIGYLMAKYLYDRYIVLE
jgi:hypothetical protein